MKLYSLKFLSIFIIPILFLFGCNSIRNISKNKKIINDEEVYMVYGSDHKAPKKIEGLVQFEYESVYAIKLKKYRKNNLSKGIRLSEIGYTRDPIWNKKGNEIAYLSFIPNDSTKSYKGQVKINNISNSQIKILEDVNACYCGLSWDESGNILAFGEKNFLISIYNIKENSKKILFQSKSRPEGISISPNGKHIVFMTRDGSNENDADGWRPNLYTIDEEYLIKIGLINDKFGVLNDFRWNNNSSLILFNGFFLDEENKRTYKYWTYDLETQELNPYNGSGEEFQNQSLRNWNDER